MPGFENLTRPNKAADLPGYIGYIPQLKYKCGHTYGFETDKLTRRYTMNEKLHPMQLPDPRIREPYLPVANGDRKLTSRMVPGYSGDVPGLKFLYGQRYKEATEEAVSDFFRRTNNYNDKSEALKRNTRSCPVLKQRSDFRDPPKWPEIKPRYGKNFRFSDHREFTEAPIAGYTGYVPRRTEHHLAKPYKVWTREAFNDSANTKAREEHLLTQRIEPTSLRTGRFAGVITLDGSGHGAIYKDNGMIPKYTGYVPQRRFAFGSTYGDTTRELPICADTNGYSTAKYLTTPLM